MKAAVFELDIESDIEAVRFSRILATVVNGSPVFLEKVIVGGAIVYPMRPGSLFDPLTVRTCRFRVRNSQSLLTRTDIDDIGVRVRSQFAWSTLRLVTDEPQNSLLAS